MTKIDRRSTGHLTREALLSAAARLLEGGASISTLSVAQVVREAGMSRATFYLHFPDKQALVAALAEDLFAWREYIGAEVLADPDLDRADLARMLGMIVDRWSEHRAALGALVEVAEYDEELGAAWRREMRRIADTAAIQLEERWRRIGRRDGDPRLIAEVFTWMFERSCHQMLRSGTSPDALAEGLTAIIWSTISKPS